MRLHRWDFYFTKLRPMKGNTNIPIHDYNYRGDSTQDDKDINA